MKPTVLVLLVLEASLVPARASAQDSLRFTSLVAGWAHTCGLTKAGRAYCWGWNPAGALGIGDTVVSTTPVAVTGGLTFTTLAASLTHTCGLATGGAAYCWGENDYGQLGAATSERCSKMENSPCSSKALPVSGGLVFATIAAGFQHTCALTPTGAAYCWGRNDLGQLGSGDTQPSSPTPTAVAGGIRLVTLGAGGFHTCGLTAAGEAYCWGGNSVGQLGRGDDTGRGVTPVPVSGGNRFKTVTAGRAHTCGVTQAQSVLCWGSNADQQLGAETAARCADQGRTLPCSRTPLRVSDSLVATAVSGGAGHTCALTPGGRAYCWSANNRGQLGDGTATGRRATRAVATDLTFAALIAGGQYTCALLSTGAPYCWGANQNGQLGHATGSDSGLPARVVAATATPSPIPALKLPGATQADAALQRDTQNYLLTVGAALATDMSCPHARVINTEVVKQPRNVQVRDGRMVRGEWTEKWTVNFCGKSVAFEIQYSADGHGGVNFRARAQ